MTFSHREVVTGFIAMGYLGIQSLRGAGKGKVLPRWNFLWRKSYFWHSVALLLSLVFLAVWCGLAKRPTGCSGWWSGHAKDESLQRIKILPLQGVGNRIDWAWDSVIEMVKKRFGTT
jgi:hypothetical protein